VAEAPAQWTEVEGRRLAWRAVGRGPELVLVNGYASTAVDWDPGFLIALARRFRVICPDNRGMGGSDPGDPEEISIDGMAADLEALLDALGLQRARLAGWSMGGFVVQRLAERSPGRVAALALLGTDAGGSESAVGDREVWHRLSDHSGTPRQRASRLIALLFPPEVAATVDRDYGDVVATARARLGEAALSAQELAMVAWRKREPPAAPRPAPPTAVVHGELDVIIPAANAPLLGERWGAGTVEVLAGGGHAFMAQEPDRAAAAIVAVASSR
jgi:pimeloyl-ACP methyl ester carboxylesterase